MLYTTWHLTVVLHQNDQCSEGGRFLVSFHFVSAEQKSSRHLTHHAAGKADAPQPRADVVPHADAAPADTLAHGELQEEQRDANQDEQDQIGHQVRPCQSKHSAPHTRWSNTQGQEAITSDNIGRFHFLEATMHMGRLTHVALSKHLVGFHLPCDVWCSQTILEAIKDTEVLH